MYGFPFLIVSLYFSADSAESRLTIEEIKDITDAQAALQYLRQLSSSTSNKDEDLVRLIKEVAGGRFALLNKYFPLLSSRKFEGNPLLGLATYPFLTQR